MARFVLIHGAFRGGWAWEPVAARLRAGGHTVAAPTLDRSDDASLGRWAGQVVDTVESVAGGSGGVVLCGHSQGGLVARLAAEACADRLIALAYLDAPVPLDGERPCDLLPGGPPPAPPPGTTFPPAPLTADGDLDGERAAALSRLLVAEPAGPAFEPVRLRDPDAAAVPEHHAFCRHTPPGFPATTTRARLDRAGTPYTVLDAGHDAPLTHLATVVAWLAGIAGVPGPPAATQPPVLTQEQP